MVGLLFQSTILIIPSGFNSDAVESSLVYDIIYQKKRILFSNTGHTKVALNFSPSQITPLNFHIFNIGFVDLGVRSVILLYNLR